MADQNLKSLAFFQDDLLENQWPVLSCSAAKELQVDSKIKTTDLQASGIVQALTFLGDGSNLTGVVKNLDLAVKKAGDTMTGALTIQNNLTVTGTISGNIDAENITSGTLSVDRIPNLVATRGENTFTGTQSIEGNLSVQGEIKWGNSRLQLDQGGSIELGGDPSTPGSGRPYIDFHFAGVAEDYNARIINDDNGRLSLIAKDVCVVGKFTNSSSKELKENIERLSIQEAVQTLAELNPVKFNYKTDSDQRQNIGFIAEDVPEFLATSDRKGVSVMDIVGVLTKVLQDQQITISVLTEKIKALEPPIQKSY
ncbi:MAG: tail fiber domain-containing protein [Microcystis sp. M_OC_Ca_00000000_S217Cul]|uniref:Tail fiber domain-containing protein n=1 Tax=Microcystis aeruginosa BLCC-F108 TaxID=2755317 RepID=A0A841UQ64_MICAE|nr:MULTISPECIES: tail fiber domain-containing protein [Microcystis]MBC1190760.1 tail fiber domain-containing protein [Microcystis aeruginosa BLCC-F108]MCA2590802.1 tail fiber domain-containing protein [Microcystis sp. M31BS1]MDB9406974.1 tail fiber domain-containing protein [Microcystis aeruginosa CS-558/01A06]TRT75442.1 MAG: tail fiber domain-containing protein [Microcystis sp. M_OC_Ca_00000000_S217Cul]TRT84500.1 MAG: tail fiber domain-containing protein [Microcystis sp. M_OC_Ca_00000000_C217